MGSRSNRDDAGFQIDTSRPRLQNKDGSISTERTITVGLDDRYYNIPTIWDGKQVDDDTAVRRARGALAAGKKFPNFSSLDEAEEQAKKRSTAIGRAIGIGEANMGRSNKESSGRANKRVEVPLYQKRDKTYGAKSDLKPVEITATKKFGPAKKRMAVTVPEKALSYEETAMRKRRFNPGGSKVDLNVSGPHRLKSGKLYE